MLGRLKAGGMVASMDQGGSPITWLLIQVFLPAQNIPFFHYYRCNCKFI